MKFLSLATLLLASLVVTTGNNAQANQILHCTRGAGGPGPSQAMLRIQANPNNSKQFSVEIKLVNPAFPQGVLGSFVVRQNQPMQQLDGQGKINGSIDSNIILVKTATNYLLTIYTGGDQRIEYGYGAHFMCN